VDATQNGISAVFQELSIVNNMSIAENIYFNHQPIGIFGLVRFKQLFEETRKMLALFGIDDLDPRTLVDELSMANRQLIEILKAMSYNPQVLILDEPTSSLTDVEVKQLFNNIRRLKGMGVTFILISHHLNEIFEIADNLSVFRDGKLVCNAGVSEVDENFLISNMVGRTIDDIYGLRQSPIGSSCIDVKHISRKGSFEDVSFTIAAGEIVGFYGLIGAGRTEVGRAIFGLEPVETGTISIDGKPVAIKKPIDAMQNIGYVTEDRKQLGLFLNQAIKANIVSNKLGEVSRGFFINDKRIVERSWNASRTFNIIAKDIEQKVVTLSGGNQQKVLLAEWFDMNLKFLIIDEPTRGVDIGARSDIYKYIRRLAEKGTAVMLISSDLLEVISLSDRIVVMKNGKISGEIPGSEATEQKVLTYAIGV
jgi:ABC-type sugar transport system ATPase subunit